ncbi:hypothetical protein CRUP_010994, partial [Coryphaenoides rupestris]
MEDLDINITLNKEEPDTPLAALMKTRGADRLREALGSYVGFLKTGVKISTCKFSMTETFLTSPPELYKVFLNQ